MRRPQEIADEELAMGTILNLTTAFEGIASMRIAQIKNRVQEAQNFFDELWHIYNQLRVDQLFRFGREDADAVIDKELYIAITAEGGFSGDIDQKLINWMLKSYDPAKQDLIIIGHHGAIQLAQAGVQYKKYYKLPEKDENINVAPLTRHVREYRTTTVYYQTYVSLMVQDIKRIELRKAVQEAATKIDKNQETISEETYIFEPSTFAVVAHLERSMVDISLSQTILESKLAQYASRFRAMSAAKSKATESHDQLRWQYNQTKRALADERLKEIINGLKKVVVS
ncbi:MAG TPA: F0F1 ATP synthase subunit gamma [Candidatus Saccharimonadales bacterium]